MTNREQLIQEIQQAPDALVVQVLQFLRSQKTQLDTRTEQRQTSNDRPIWELFESAADELPEDVLAQLPTDGAAQHDHYLYGTPKRDA